MRILLDMDGTINNFPAEVIAEVEKRGYGFDHRAYDDYNMEEFFLGTDNPDKLMDEICRSMDFWMNLQPLPGSQAVLKEVDARHDIVIATSPWDKEDPKFKAVKVDWLRKHFGFLRKNEIIFTADKWELDADMIVDDKPKILQKCADLMITVKIVQPYNQKVESDFEFGSWMSFPRIMKIVEKFERESIRRGR